MAGPIGGRTQRTEARDNTCFGGYCSIEKDFARKIGVDDDLAFTLRIMSRGARQVGDE